MDRPQNIPGQVFELKPDYGRIRKAHLKMCFNGAFVVFLFQVALYIVFKFHLLPLEFKTSEFVHLLKYLIIPSSINFGVVAFAYILNKREDDNEFLHNAVPILAMSVICAVTASAHSVYSVTLMLVCLPLIMASVYG